MGFIHTNIPYSTVLRLRALDVLFCFPTIAALSENPETVLLG
jgi:hypothetical protein